MSADQAVGLMFAGVAVGAALVYGVFLIAMWRKPPRSFWGPSRHFHPYDQEAKR